LTPDEVFDLACQAGSAEAEAIVLSCTDMRSVEAADRIEAALGKPVVCSNQAMMFQACEMLQTRPERPCGMLFDLLRIND